MARQVEKGAAADGRRRAGRPARWHRRRVLQLEALEARWLPASTLSLGDATVVEGDSGTVDLVFPVTRTGDLNSTITVGYTTADGTATAGSDYTAVPAGTVTIAEGSVSAEIRIPAAGDLLNEANETFSVTLTGILDEIGPTLSFAPQATFATGSIPFSVAVSDVNGDGRPDLAVLNNSSNSVSVLLNQTAPGAAAPGFAPQATFATGSAPYSLAVGDVNGDGRPDLAVANRFPASVSVLLNQTAPGASAPSFAPQASFATVSFPSSVALGDVNGDGRPDLAVAYFNSASVSVLLNQTAPGAAVPSFAPQASFATGSGPRSVAVGDVNGDGQPDLAVSNYYSNSVSVLLNQTVPGAASPSFAPQATFDTGSRPSSVVLGDVNGDGRPDLAVANSYSSSVSALLNQTAPGAAAPSFATQATFTTGPSPNSVAVGDVNGDGRPDLAVANLTSTYISVLLNQTAPGAAAPSFAPQAAFATGISPASVALDDVNGDGRPDLAVANLNSASVSVLLNQTALGTVAPSFAPQTTFATGSGPSSVAVGDVNGDGRPDLALVNINSDSVSVLLNQTALGASVPNFATQATFATGPRPYSFALGDVNGDGRPDLTIANFNSNNVSVLLNQTTPGAAFPSFAPQATFATMTRPISVAVGDVNGDGRPDLAVANFGANSVSVLLNQTAPGASALSFAPQAPFATENQPFDVAIGDLNGDGRPDLALANTNSDSVSVLLNQTAPGAAAPSFATQATFATGPSPYSVAVGDVNGDGRPDLALANTDSNSVSVLLNQTAPGTAAPSFAPQATFAAGSTSFSVAVGDLNGDGRPDLAVANVTTTYVSVLLNQTAPGAAAPGFAPQATFATGTSPRSVAVGDINGDGRPDLAVANSFNSVAVLLNANAPSTIADAVGIGTIVNDDSLIVTTVADGGPGSLRQTILVANATPGTNVISFAIPGSGVRTIQPQSVLPTITDPVVIDAYTQPGASPNTLAEGDNAVLLIELSGAMAGPSASGLVFLSGNNTVAGLVINRFGGSGIMMTGSGGNVLRGNFIGTDVTGTIDLGNQLDGVLIDSASGNTVGGTSAGARNLISGNGRFGVFISNVGASGNLVAGNFIGTDVNGTSDLGNTDSGVVITAADNTVGGTAPGACNLISGNDGSGVGFGSVAATGNAVLGNFIGTDVTGTIDRGNSIQGVAIFNGAARNTIGGTTVSAGNLISGNGESGVAIGGQDASDNLVLGNLIGTDANGTADLGNTFTGIFIFFTAARNTVGGTAPGARNVISGNDGTGILLLESGTNTIQGNRIGTDATGTLRLGNTGDGVSVSINSPDNTIGGVVPGVGNVIAANLTNGVRLEGAGSTRNLVSGNFIGTNASATAVLGNSGSGILLGAGATDNTIGGTGAAGSNSIAFNGSGLDVSSGAGTTNFTGTNTNLQATIVNSGIFQFLAHDAIPITSAVTVAPGAVLNLNDFDDTIGSLGGGGSVTLGSGTLATSVDNTATTFSGVISGTGGLSKRGSGTLTLAGTNTYTGSTTVAAGTLSLVGGNALADTGAVNLSTVGATLDLQTSETIGSLAGVAGTEVTLNAQTLTTGDGGSTSFLGVVGGSGGLTKQGGGTFTLGGANTYTGSTTIGAGTLALGAGDVLADAGSVSVNGGTLALGNFSETVAAITLIGGVITGTSGTLSSTSTFIVQSGTVGAILGGGVGLTKTTGGTVTLSGVNTYAGLTVVQAGILDLAAAGGNAIPGDLIIGDNLGGFGADVVRLLASHQVADTATVTVTGSGQLVLNGFTDTFALLVATVADTGDSGPASLREAIATANGTGGPAAITFSLTGPGPFTIRPASALPAITDRVAIDGTSQPGFAGRPLIELDGTAAGAGVDGLTITGGGSTVAGLAINRFGGRGVVLAGGGGNVVRGNFIGTDVTGLLALGNARDGVLITADSSANSVGGTLPGEGNTIAFNGGAGVTILSGAGNGLRGNAISANAGLGIDLGGDGVSPNDAGDADGSPNDLQNFPVLTVALSLAAVTRVTGTLNSTPNSAFIIELFASSVPDPSGFGEGSIFIGSVATTTDGAGNASFSADLVVPPGAVITATATDPAGNTSEFSLAQLPILVVDLAVSLTAVPDPAVVDDVLSYTVTVVNNGPSSATGVVVTDTLPEGPSFLSASASQGSVAQAGGIVIAHLGTVPGGGSASITIFVTPDTAGLLRNTATVAGNEPEPDLSNNTAVVTTTARFSFTVTNTRDAGPGSLRRVIRNANLNPGPDRIVFLIPGAGPHTISPASALPPITDPVTIDAATQPGFAGAPVVELAGDDAGPDASGLVILAGSSTVRGLVINRFAGSGIVLRTGGGNAIVGNYLGTDLSGTLDRGNARSGVRIVSSPGNTIGGPSPAHRNVLSGNDEVGVRIEDGPATANLVLGNLIGTDVTGTRRLNNTTRAEIGLFGVLIQGAAGNTIGGTAPAARNVVSGHDSVGIRLFGRAAQNVVAGNFIGTDITGTAPLPNAFDGVFLDGGASGNTIGGTAAGAGNLISGNGSSGIQLFGAGTSGNVIQGNQIGTDVTGTSPVGNRNHGVFLNRASGNTIGGEEPGAGNVISGNVSVGVQIFGPGASANVVRGNLIGTDASGTIRRGLGNRFGLFLNAAPGNTIGRSNLIRGNADRDIIDTGALGVVVQDARLIDDGTVVTGLVLTFSTDMDRARVEDIRNYRIRPLRRGTRTGVRTAAYDEVARTVTLTLSQPIGRDVALRLVVNAAIRRGLTDTNGRLLDGNADGRPGGNDIRRLGPPAAPPSAGPVGAGRRSRTAAANGGRISARAIDLLLRTGEFPAVSRRAKSRSTRGPRLDIPTGV